MFANFCILGSSSSFHRPLWQHSKLSARYYHIQHISRRYYPFNAIADNLGLAIVAKEEGHVVRPFPARWIVCLSLFWFPSIKINWLTIQPSFSTCIASIIRVTSIGVIQGGDDSCMCPCFRPNFSPSHRLTDSFLTTYLWSHVEPATAILCACITTYRPLVISIKESLQSKFSRSKENVSKEKPWYSGSSNSNFNDGSSRSRSLPESMRWPIGRGLRGQADLRYQNLNRKATSDKLHVIHVLPKQHDSVPHTAEYECTTIAVGREASLT